MRVFSVPNETTWFELTARENFEKYLGRPERCLQLGCFTGDASVWMLENTGCHLQDVDTFKGSDEHQGFDFDEVWNVYDSRMAPYRDRTHLWIGPSEDYLVSAANSLQKALGFREFDFIYIDADHHAKEVLRDAVMAWPLLKKGGLMAFDDYEWGQGMPALDTPRPGIDAFLTVYSPEIVVKNAQCWVRKG